MAAEEEMVVEVEEEDGRGSWRRRRRQQQEQEQGGDADEDEDGKSFQSAESSSKMNSRWARGGRLRVTEGWVWLRARPVMRRSRRGA